MSHVPTSGIIPAPVAGGLDGREVRRLKARDAATLLELSRKQVTRLCQAYKRDGAAGIVSRKRGRPSNRKTDPAVEARAVQLVRDLYGDFGPTLAREKLAEKHGIRLGR